MNFSSPVSHRAERRFFHGYSRNPDSPRNLLRPRSQAKVPWLLVCAAYESSFPHGKGSGIKTEIVPLALLGALTSIRRTLGSMCHGKASYTNSQVFGKCL